MYIVEALIYMSEEKPWGYTPSDVSQSVGLVLQELLEG